MTPLLTRAMTSAPQIRHIGQHELRIARLQRHGAPRRPLHLLVLRDQAMALMRHVHLDLAGRRRAEALLGTGLRLELGHFSILGSKVSIIGDEACPEALARGPAAEVRVGLYGTGRVNARIVRRMAGIRVWGRMVYGSISPVRCPASFSMMIRSV